MPAHLMTQKGLDKQFGEALEHARKKNTRVKIRDGAGLVLVVRQDGGASWLYRYSFAGQRGEVTLGAYPLISLAVARDLHKKKAELVANGVDPRKAKADAKERARAQAAAARLKADTVLQLTQDWLAKKSGSDVHKSDIWKAFKRNVLPAIGAKAPADVTREHVLAILREIEGRGSLDMLKRVRMWMAEAFEFACHDETRNLPSNPVPRGKLVAFQQHHGDSYPAVTDATLVPGLMKAIDSWPQPVTRMAMLMLAHTFQRPSMVREATWEEIDLDARKWVLKERKGMKIAGNGEKREHWVPISPVLANMLRAHQGLVGDSGMLFPGLRAGKPISEATMNAALATLGYKNRHTPHGFRAMGMTVLKEALGWADRGEVIDKHLLHEKKSKVQRAYDRALYWDQRVQMANEWSAWLDAQMRGD